MKKLYQLSSILIVAAALGCGGNSDNDGQPTANATVATASDEVVWTELRKVDDLAHRMEAALSANNEERIAEVAPQLHEAIVTLAKSDVPANAKDKATAETLLNDIDSLADAMGDLSDMTVVKVNAAAVYPVIHQLMQAAALPHKHDQPDHDHDSEQDHDGHDHDTDHDHDH